MGNDWGSRGWEEVGGLWRYYIIGQDKTKIYLTAGDYSVSRDSLVWVINGPLVTGQNQDDMRVAIRDGQIIATWLTIGQRGGSGSSIVDVNKGTPGTPHTTQQNDIALSTIYTTQANRPTLTGAAGEADENAMILSAEPDVKTFLRGDLFGIDLDQIAPQAEDLAVMVEVEYFG